MYSVVGLMTAGGALVQAYDAKYIPDTCNMLLKWKPSSHNSVDFTLLPYTERVVQDSRDCVAAHTAGQQLFLGVWAEGRVVIAYDVDHDRLAAIGPDDSLKKALTTKPARVAFPGGEDPEQFHGMVIECNFDGDKHEWCFMRDRAKCVALGHLAGACRILGGSAGAPAQAVCALRQVSGAVSRPIRYMDAACGCRLRCGSMPRQCCKGHACCASPVGFSMI